MNLPAPTALPVFKVVRLQCAIAVVFAALIFFLRGVPQGWAAAYGGLVAVVGSALYALNVAGGANHAGHALRAHVRAEIVKIFASVMLFALALLLFTSAAWLWLMLGFAVATLAYWVALLAV